MEQINTINKTFVRVTGDISYRKTGIMKWNVSIALAHF